MVRIAVAIQPLAFVPVTVYVVVVVGARGGEPSEPRAGNGSVGERAVGARGRGTGEVAAGVEAAEGLEQMLGMLGMSGGRES